MKASVEDLHVADAIELLRIGVGDRIAIVNAIDLSGFHEAIDIELTGPECSRGVGREIGVAGTCSEDDHTALVKMAHRSTPDVGLGNLLHVNGRLNTAENAVTLECVLQSQGIHHRCQHADVISLSAIHTFCGASKSAEDVTASDNNGQLHAILDNWEDLFS